MANSQLYLLLSGLTITDNKIWSTLSDHLKDHPSSSSIITKASNGNSLSSLVNGNTITFGVSDKGITSKQLADVVTTDIAKGVSVYNTVLATSGEWNDGASLSSLTIDGTALAKTNGVANIPLASGTTKGVVYNGGVATISNGQITAISEAGKTTKSFTVFGQSFNGSAAKSVTAGNNLSVTNGVVNVIPSGTAASATDTGLVSGGLVYNLLLNKLNVPETSGTDGQYLTTNGTNTEWSTINVPEVVDDLSDGASVLTGLDGTSPISISGSGHTRTISIATDIEINDQSTNQTVPTNKAIYDYVHETIAMSHVHTNEATLNDITSEKVAAWDKGAAVSGVTLEKLVSATSGYAASYQLKVNGTAVGPTIDITKDKFLNAAEFGYSSVNSSAGTGWSTAKSTTAKYPTLRLTFWVNSNGDYTDDSSTASYVYIPLNDLVDTYTGSNNIKVNNYNISLSGTVGSATKPMYLNNGVLTQLNYDLSTFTLKSNLPVAAGKVMAGTGTAGTLSSTAYSIGTVTSGSFGTDNMIATEAGVKEYVDAKVAGVDATGIVGDISALTKQVNVLSGNISGAYATGNYIVTTKEKFGGIQASQYYITNEAIAFTKSTNNITIPTMFAVTGWVDTNYYKKNNIGANYFAISDGSNNLTGSTFTTSDVSNAISYATDWNSNKANYVSASSNFVANQILVGEGENKKAKASGVTIGSSTLASSPTSSVIATEVAVKTYADSAVSGGISKAENYVLNGAAGTSIGVTDWANSSTTEGSLAYLIAKVENLLAAIA